MSDGLRVTVVSDASAVWGSERSILMLVPHLRAQGIELTLACPPGEFARAGAEMGLPHAPTVLPRRGGERRNPVRDMTRDALGVAAGVRRIAFATRGADVVHSNNLLFHPDAALAGRRSGIPTLLELHDIVAPGAPTAAMSAAAALADSVVAISTASAAGVRGPGRQKVAVVPQCVNAELYSPGPCVPAVRESLGGGPVLVTMVGRLDPTKGAHRLVRAASVLPDVRVAVVGEPSIDEGSYAAEVGRLGHDLLGDRFIRAGRRADVVDVLRSSDILVNMSDAEPFGLSLLEAMACGVAVVAVGTGGVPDFITDDVTGLLIGDADDEAGLVAALRRLHERGLRERLGSAARAHVLAAHTAEQRAERIAAIYRDLARSERVVPRRLGSADPHHQFAGRS